MAETVDSQRQSIADRKSRWVREYPALWQRMAAEWRSGAPDDQVWMLYSANYLLRTGGTLWAIDPFCLKSRIPETPEVDLRAGLRDLSFVLLTHHHADHLDLALIQALRDQPITWVIPDFLVDEVTRQTGLPRSRVIVPRVQEPLEIAGVGITPFDGLHFEYLPGRPPRGVPALGYLAECKGRRLLFPGDTRSYAAGQLPQFGPVDWLFAHLWLGRGCALAPRPPLLEPFCQFFLDLQPRHIAITHLHELGRAPDDYWETAHFERVRERLAQLAPGLPVQSREMGERIEL